MATWVHPTILILNPLLINAPRKDGTIYYVGGGLHSSGTSETLNLRIYLCLKHSMDFDQLIMSLPLLGCRTVKS